MIFHLLFFFFLAEMSKDAPPLCDPSSLQCDEVAASSHSTKLKKGFSKSQQSSAVHHLVFSMRRLPSVLMFLALYAVLTSISLLFPTQWRGASAGASRSSAQPQPFFLFVRATTLNSTISFSNTVFTAVTCPGLCADLAASPRADYSSSCPFYDLYYLLSSPSSSSNDDGVCSTAGAVPVTTIQKKNDGDVHDSSPPDSTILASFMEEGARDSDASNHNGVGEKRRRGRLAAAVTTDSSNFRNTLKGPRTTLASSYEVLNTAQFFYMLTGCTIVITIDASLVPSYSYSMFQAYVSNYNLAPPVSAKTPSSDSRAGITVIPFAATATAAPTDLAMAGEGEARSADDSMDAATQTLFSTRSAVTNASATTAAATTTMASSSLWEGLYPDISAKTTFFFWNQPRLHCIWNAPVLMAMSYQQRTTFSSSEAATGASRLEMLGNVASAGHGVSQAAEESASHPRYGESCKAGKCPAHQRRLNSGLSPRKTPSLISTGSSNSTVSVAATTSSMSSSSFASCKNYLADPAKLVPTANVNSVLSSNFLQLSSNIILKVFSYDVWYQLANPPKAQTSWLSQYYASMKATAAAAAAKVEATRSFTKTFSSVPPAWRDESATSATASATTAAATTASGDTLMNILESREADYRSIGSNLLIDPERVCSAPALYTVSLNALLADASTWSFGTSGDWLQPNITIVHRYPATRAVAVVAQCSGMPLSFSITATFANSVGRPGSGQNYYTSIIYFLFLVCYALLFILFMILIVPCGKRRRREREQVQELREREMQERHAGEGRTHEVATRRPRVHAQQRPHHHHRQRHRATASDSQGSDNDGSTDASEEEEEVMVERRGVWGSSAVAARHEKRHNNNRSYAGEPIRDSDDDHSNQYACDGTAKKKQKGKSGVDATTKKRGSDAAKSTARCDSSNGGEEVEMSALRSMHSSASFSSSSTSSASVSASSADSDDAAAGAEGRRRSQRSHHPTPKVARARSTGAATGTPPQKEKEKGKKKRKWGEKHARTSSPPHSPSSDDERVLLHDGDSSRSSCDDETSSLASSRSRDSSHYSDLDDGDDDRSNGSSSSSSRRRRRRRHRGHHTSSSSGSGGEAASFNIDAMLTNEATDGDLANGTRRHRRGEQRSKPADLFSLLLCCFSGADNDVRTASGSPRPHRHARQRAPVHRRCFFALRRAWKRVQNGIKNKIVMPLERWWRESHIVIMYPPLQWLLLVLILLKVLVCILYAAKYALLSDTSTGDVTSSYSLFIVCFIFSITANTLVIPLEMLVGMGWGLAFTSPLPTNQIIIVCLCTVGMFVEYVFQATCDTDGYNLAFTVNPYAKDANTGRCNSVAYARVGVELSIRLHNVLRMFLLAMWLSRSVIPADAVAVQRQRRLRERQLRRYRHQQLRDGSRAEDTQQQQQQQRSTHKRNRKGVGGNGRGGSSSSRSASPSSSTSFSAAATVRRGNGLTSNPPPMPPAPISLSPPPRLGYPDVSLSAIDVYLHYRGMWAPFGMLGVFYILQVTFAFTFFQPEDHYMLVAFREFQSFYLFAFIVLFLRTSSPEYI